MRFLISLMTYSFPAKVFVWSFLGVSCLFVEAIAGPFGLEKGMSLKDIGGQSQQSKAVPGQYLLSKVPKPHPAFEGYVIKLAPKAGLCHIRAVGKDIKTSSYGLELKNAFNAMEKKLEGTYKKHETADVLLPGSIWSEPNDWMMGLAKKERFLIAEWSARVRSTLPTDLEEISLQVNPLDGNTGYIEVNYLFTNIDACEEELAAKEDGAL